jgi:hypothetical protein
MGVNSRIKDHAKKYPNDIYIGGEMWISWMDLPIDKSSAVQIDTMFGPCAEVFERLETICVAGCCGFSAYDFSPEAIIGSVNGLEQDQILRQLKCFREDVIKFNSDIIVSDRMNNYAHKDVFVKLLDHVIGVVESKCVA